MELIAPFSSLENMMEYLRRKKKEFRLTESDLEEFKNNRQTKGRDENYLYESDYLDVLPEQEPELPPKDDAFYDKVFTCGQSELSRRELESLPEPFDTYHVTDEEMEQIMMTGRRGYGRGGFFSKRGEYSTPYTKRLPTLKKTDL